MTNRSLSIADLQLASLLGPYQRHRIGPPNIQLGNRHADKTSRKRAAKRAKQRNAQRAKRKHCNPGNPPGNKAARRFLRNIEYNQRPHGI